MLQVAQAGYIGVNLHGGGNGLYTPIAGDRRKDSRRAPSSMACCSPSALPAARSSTHRFRLRPPRRTLLASRAANAGSHGWKLAIFNKARRSGKHQNHRSASHQAKADVTLMQGLPSTPRRASPLAEAASARTALFLRKPQLTVTMQHGTGVLALPAYTAAYIEL